MLQLRLKSLIVHKNYPWLAWGLAAGFFLVEYVARIAPAVMAPQLMSAFNVTAFGLGVLSSFFYYIYVGMQIPVGILVDRYGVRRWLIIATIICVIACALFAYAQSFWVAALARLLIGLSAAFAFVSALKIARTWFPTSMLGFLAGTTQALGMLGATFGEGPVAYGVVQLGWRPTMLIITLAVAIIATLIALFVYDHPEHTTTNNYEKPESLPVKTGLAIVLKNRHTWFNAIFAGFIYAPSAAFAELWGVSFIHTTYHLSMTSSANCVMFIFIGWAVGAPLLGILSDRLTVRLPIMRFATIGSLVCLVAVIYGPWHQVIVLAGILFFYGICNSGLALSYAYAGEFHPKQVAGLSMAFTNMASVIIGAFLQPLIGYILDILWDGQNASGIRVYSTEHFKTALLILPGCFLVALLMTFFARETHCQNYEARCSQS